MSVQTALGAVEIILKAREQKKLLMITALWFTWSERNAIREEGRRRCSRIIARSVELYVNEMNMSISLPSARRSRQPARWTRPPADILKLNCDASFLPESKTGSWGVLIRDCDGDLVSTGRGRINHLLSPFHAELIACLQGIQLAVDLGIGRIIVETDAQEVVKAIKSSSYDASVVGHLVDEIKFLLASNFLSFECVFIGRECNRAAH